MANWIDELKQAGDHATRLVSDFEYFAPRCLKIRPKAGAIEAFKFNPAQLELHRIIEAQKAKTGRVRVVILKARQMGISTYIAGRFYHRTINNLGMQTGIITHESPATRNLFRMVKRFHENMPDDLRPTIGASNAEELIFDKTDSGYSVSVATTEGAGRSATLQALHASEAARWQDFPQQIGALLQTVPDMDGTEVIFETTGNGFNDFHKFWRNTESGKNEFLAVFLPWSLDPAYRRALPEGFAMTPDEKQLAELHKLDAEQICWRRNKITQMESPELFAQEYPLTPEEAFMASDFDSYITPLLVLKARRENIEPYGPLLIGVDPAGKGKDSTAIAWRRGHCITKIEKRHGLDTMEVAGLVARIIREEKPAKVSIDVGGLGIGVYDRLIEQGFDSSVVVAVNFGGKPIEPPAFDETGKPAGGPANRRAELYRNLKGLLEGRFQLPDSNSLQGDLTGIGYKYTSDGRLLLESKDDMRRRGVPSPDEGDAVALCCTEPEGSPFPRSSGFNRAINYGNSEAYV